MNIVKLRSKSNRCYVFDGISNNFYEIEEKDFDVDICPSDLGHASPYRELPSTDINSELNNAKTLMIELTGQCNLRCKYCIYDSDVDIDRNHNQKTIEKKLLLDEIYNFSSRVQNDGYIVFYGGEPTLSFGLIKDAVSFANEIKNKNFKYSLTTNGYSISNEMVRYFIENDFKITFSLDGSKTIHDKNRISINGSGTFEKIISNINKIRNKNHDFFQRNVSFNCVINDPEDIPEINNFFESFGAKSSSIRYSSSIQSSDRVESYLLNLISSKDSAKLKDSSVENVFLSDVLNRIRFRHMDDGASLFKKPCIPFSNRTYLRIDGSLTFCERVGSYGEVTSSDDIKSKATNVYSDFYHRKNESCKYCYAYNFCDMCIASFVKNNSIDLSLEKEKCSRFRKLVELSLTLYLNEKELESSRAQKTRTE